jgi:hypothetical protein
VGGTRETLIRERAPTQLRRLVLLGAVLFLLATAVPGSAATGKKPRRDPQLEDAGPPAFTGTCIESTGRRFPCPPQR